ncbi:MAG: DNA-binding protein [Clostridia bacterium]|nr:DNA-binding protein [Clostridia bacterium]
MKTICIRLKRGSDLLESIEEICKENDVKAGVILSMVGCVTKARVRDASGVTIKEVDEDLEIVSGTGTVSKARCHVHVSFSKEDLSVIGGHLVKGCIVNTTCELVILVLDGIEFREEFDQETGYDELKVLEI